jgi:predicted transcriptional regulator
LRPPCEEIVQQFLPVFRSLVAKELIERHKFSQVEAARRLGTTQAAVSQYLGSKRGFKDPTKLKSTIKVKMAASQVAKDLAENRLTHLDVATSFCKLCIALRENQDRCNVT